MWRSCASVLLFFLAGVAILGCGSPESTPSSQPEISTPSLTQTDEGQGGVTFKATVVTYQYMAERGHPPDHVGFLVSLDTHSGSLLGYDLVALATLRDDSGRMSQALGWEPQSEDSHHRSGLLYFDGLASLATGGQYTGLSLKNLGGVSERVLRWEMPLP